MFSLKLSPSTGLISIILLAFLLAPIAQVSAAYTWTALTPPVNGDWTAVDISDNGQVIAATTYNGSIYVSVDGGSVWETKLPGGVTELWTDIAIDADGSHMIVSSDGGSVYTSTSTGAYWQLEMDVNYYMRGVAIDSDGSHMVAVDQNADVHVSANSGSTWSSTNYLTMSGAQGYFEDVDMSADGSIIVVADWDTGLFKSADSGATWTLIPGTGQFSFDIAIDDDATHMIGALYDGVVRYSNDSGATWNEGPTTSEIGSVYWRDVDIDSDGSHMIAVSSLSPVSGKIYTSSDSGATWTEEQPMGATLQDWYATAMTSDGAKTIVAASDATANTLYLGNFNVVAVDSEPPTISGASPSGELAAGITEATLSVTTNEEATCKYSTTALVDFGTKTAFTTTGITSHEIPVTGLSAGNYSYFVTCSDTSNNLSTETEVSFSIAAAESAGGTSSSSGSLTIESRVMRLIQAGKIQEAISLMRRYPDKYPYMVQTSVPVEVGDNPALMSVAAARDLEEGTEGEDVRNLQRLLNSLGFMVASTGAGSIGNETNYFGSLTRSALSKYQAAHGIAPAAGYFGPITRNKMKVLGHTGLWW